MPEVLCVFLSFFRSDAELHYFLWNNGLSYGTIQEGRKSDTVFFLMVKSGACWESFRDCIFRRYEVSFLFFFGV